MFSRLFNSPSWPASLPSLDAREPRPKSTASRARRLVYRMFLGHGPDAVGLIGLLGDFFTSRNGNIVTLKFHTMGPYYVASVEVAALEEDMALISRDARESHIFQAFTRTTIRSLPYISPGLRDTQHRVEITAMDHPGMVRQVGEATARYDFNISYAHGVLYPEPLSDRAFFAMKLIIDVPERSSDRLEAYKATLLRLEPTHGFKVYGPAPERSDALFTSINWTENLAERLGESR